MDDSSATTAAVYRPITWDELNLRTYYICGPVMLGAVRATLYPFTLVKTRLQVQKGNSLYSGAGDAFKKIVRHEGVSALYKGFGTALLGLLGSNFYITTYEYTRKNLLHRGHSEGLSSLVAGGCASIVGQTITVPIDIVSQHQMLHGQKSHVTAVPSPTPVASAASSPISHAPNGITRASLLSVARKIYAREGLRGFYRGYTTSLITYAPSSSIFWLTYGCTVGFFYDAVPLHWLGAQAYSQPVSEALAGISAGVVAGFTTNPFDVIRTRQQVGRVVSARVACGELMREEGAKGFMKGVSARMMSMGQAGCLMMLSYEFLKRISLTEEARLRRKEEGML